MDSHSVELKIDRIQQQFGESAQYFQLAGRLALLKGHFDTAIFRYGRAVRLDPNNWDAKLELALSYAVRADCEKRPLDYEYAMERMLTLDEVHQTPELEFDLALIFDQVPLPRASIVQWDRVMNEEPSFAWRLEARQRRTVRQEQLQDWNDRSRELTISPGSYLVYADQTNASIELVLTEALQDWLPNYHRDPASHAALKQLARTLAAFGDVWLAELLTTPTTASGLKALQSLAAAYKANNSGEHFHALRYALQADHLFQRVRNRAGVLRARLELAYSRDRTWQHEACLAIAENLRAEGTRKNYLWLARQAWLEKISCSIQTRMVDVIADCERAYDSIPSPYKGLQLRALGFLTQKYLGFDTRLRVWSYGQKGLRTFWDNPLPLNRGYTLYYTIGSSARSAGNGHAALALLREGVYTLRDSPYRQLYALALSDLGEWEYEQGLRAEAARTFRNMDVLFHQLELNETKRFRDLAEMTRAELEINADEPNVGLKRLLRATLGMAFPYHNLSPTERRLLLPILGTAYLRTGNISKAARYYRQAILENSESLRTIHDRGQRENAQQEIEPAWKGQTEILLRRGQISLALDSWESFRSGHVADKRIAKGKPAPGVSFLAFAFLPSGLSAWLKDTRGVEQKLLDAADVKRSAERFSVLVADPSSQLVEIAREGRHLYKILIKPFEQRLANVRLVILDADGPLAGIPWSALTDDEGRTLLDKFAVDQVIGWREAAVSNARELLTLKPLIFSDPKLGPNLRKDYPSLLDARSEGDWLQRTMPDAASYTGEEATAPNLIKQLPHSTLFHFGGHGVSYGGFGALLLSPSTSSKDDTTYITSSEIARLRLTHLQLVVLAACSSGAGEQKGTVNLDSLVRGFLEAGTQSVVAARWNVSSISTSDIVVGFYRHVLKGVPPSEALRETVLSFRQETGRLHPYYWSGFQLFGAP